MKFGAVIISVLAVSVLFMGCKGDENQYSGLGDLVAERSEVRKKISDENARKKALEKNAKPLAVKGKENGEADAGEQVPSVTLYVREIQIVDAGTQLPLAKGVAYLNKSGKIVKIKVKAE